MRKSFFKSEKDRMLWVKLNAENIQYINKVLNGIDRGLGEIGEQYSFMQISLNQLEYDENNCDAPRFSFEELLTLSHKELYDISLKRTINKVGAKIFNTWNDEKY